MSISKLQRYKKKLDQRAFRFNRQLTQDEVRSRIENGTLTRDDILGNNIINTKFPDGDTLLHVAVAEENLTMVELLLDMGADVNALDVDKSTPFHIAVLGGNGEITRLLLDKGANVNIQNNEGDTPLHLVIMIHQFIPQNISPTVQNPDNIEGLAKVNLLLNKGANVRIYNENEHTPLDVVTDFEADEAQAALDDPAYTAQTYPINIKNTLKDADNKERVSLIQPRISGVMGG